MAVAREWPVFHRDRSIRFERSEEFIVVVNKRRTRSMCTSREVKMNKATIGRGCVGILAAVLALTAQAARAESGGPELGPSLEGSAQSMCVAPNGEQHDGMDSHEAYYLPLPSITCCLPPSEANHFPTCVRMWTVADCQNAGGVRTLGCARCYLAPQIAPMADEGAEASETPAGTSVSSGWALLAIALVLLPVAPLARYRR